MILEDQPRMVCESHDLSMADLERMIHLSARCTHPWANRRYQGWAFAVDLEAMHLYRMGPYIHYRSLLTD